MVLTGLIILQEVPLALLLAVVALAVLALLVVLIILGLVLITHIEWTLSFFYFLSFYKLDHTRGTLD